ncbi:MAG: septum formation initiator family protein [Candidatus Gastranaerophilales bacterium]|nr:septum formation initiator family protein [Candidatus Gastranaerophilales bacterium]
MKTNTAASNAPFQKARKNRKEKHAFYSLLTFVLIICLIQAIRGAFLNVENFFSLNHKIAELQKIKVKSLEENQDLKYQISEFKSMQGVEDVARNELKMAGKNEVLVLIKNNNQEDSDKIKHPDMKDLKTE